MVENREERVRVDAKLTFSSDGCSIELLISVKTHAFCRWLGSWVLHVGEREKKGKEMRVKEKREENVTGFRYLGTKVSFKD